MCIGSIPVPDTLSSRRLTERPGGYGPSDVRSIRAGSTAAVAELVMQRLVMPPYAGSSPVGRPVLKQTGDHTHKIALCECSLRSMFKKPSGS